MIVGEKIPGVTPFAIVLAHGSPLALGKVRPPLPPRDLLLTSFLKPSHLFIFCSVHSSLAFLFGFRFGIRTSLETKVISELGERDRQSEIDCRLRCDRSKLSVEHPLSRNK